MTKSDWYDVIRDWESTGFTQQEFCVKENLQYKEFNYWRSKGLSEGIFLASTRWKQHSSKELSKPSNFTQIGYSDIQQNKESTIPPQQIKQYF